VNQKPFGTDDFALNPEPRSGGEYPALDAGEVRGAGLQAAVFTVFRRRVDGGTGRSGVAIGIACSICVTNVFVPWSSNWIVVRISVLWVVTPIPN